MSHATTVPPTGEQVELAHGDQRAVVVTIGGGLRSYSSGGRDLLDGFAADEQPVSGRGQLLVPWPNRIEDGSYTFDGRLHQLPLTEPENANAIHGLVRAASWTIGTRAADRVVLEHVLEPQPGYPFTVEVAVAYALSDEGLSVEITARNAGSDVCPYGCGQHPYLTLGTPTVDELELQAPGRRVLLANARGLPTGTRAVAGSEYDFRAPRRIGATTLDNCFTELERASDGRAFVRLREPTSGDAVVLWMDGAFPYLMLFTGDARPDVRRRSLAVEPMTCPPNAFRTGVSLIRLEPGEVTTSAWGISPEG